MIDRVAARMRERVRRRMQRAATLSGAAEALRTEMVPLDRVHYEQILAAARVQVDDATWAAAWAEGRAMPLEQAVAYALAETARFP